MRSTMLRCASFALAAVLLLSGCGNTPAVEPSSPSSIIAIPEVSESPSKSDVPQSAPVSESSSTPAPAPETPKTWWQEFFSYKDPQTLARYIYLHDNLHKLSYDGDSCYSRLSAAITESTEASDLGKRILEDRYIELVMDSDDKYTVYFYEKGIELTYSHWKLEEKTTVKLALAEDLYTRLKQKMDQTLRESYPQGAMWLAMMNRGRIRSIAVTDPNGKSVKYGHEDSDEDGRYMMYLIEPRIRTLSVRGEALIPPVPPPMTDSTYLVEITFDNDVKYTVLVEPKRLYISSSDVAQTLYYEHPNGGRNTQTEQLQRMVDKENKASTLNNDYSFTPHPPSNPAQATD